MIYVAVTVPTGRGAPKRKKRNKSENLEIQNKERVFTDEYFHKNQGKFRERNVT
jgi:hypothetical protein